jgi:hypothetical protein
MLPAPHSSPIPPHLRACLLRPLQGAKMDYAVAVDAAGQAARQLMGPAGVSGIPHAFIIGGCLTEPLGNAYYPCAASLNASWRPTAPNRQRTLIKSQF